MVTQMYLSDEAEHIENSLEEVVVAVEGRSAAVGELLGRVDRTPSYTSHYIYISIYPWGAAGKGGQDTILY